MYSTILDFTEKSGIDVLILGKCHPPKFVPMCMPYGCRVAHQTQPHAWTSGLFALCAYALPVHCLLCGHLPISFKVPPCWRLL